MKSHDVLFLSNWLFFSATAYGIVHWPFFFSSTRESEIGSVMSGTVGIGNEKGARGVLIIFMRWLFASHAHHRRKGFIAFFYGKDDLLE